MPTVSYIPTRNASLSTGLFSSLLADAQTRLLEAELAVIAAREGRPELISGPFLLDEPVAPRPARRAAFGVLAGLLVSSLIAATVLTRDRSG